MLQFGAFSVFVADGKPSPFEVSGKGCIFLSSGIDTSAKEGIVVDRNKYFSFVKCINMCVVSEILHGNVTYLYGTWVLFLLLD